jgi:transposase
MHHIKGEQRNQLQMICLEQVVAADSFVRIIDMFVDAIDLKSFGFKHVTINEEGRPPYHPAVLLKLYLYGYRYGVRSSRKLEYQTMVNLEVRWLLNEQTPSNRTIAAFRKENAKAFRQIFRKFVYLLKQADLIGGETIAIDSFKVRGQNSLKNNFNDKKIARHLEYLDQKVTEYEQALDTADSIEEKEELEKKIQTKNQRKEAYEQIRQELIESGEEQISTTDPDAKAVILHRNVVNVGYNMQASVDAKHSLITGYDTGDVNDTHALAPVAIETKENLAVDGFNVLADKGYLTGDQLARCLEENIIPYVSPKESASNDEDIFPVTAFRFDAQSNTFTCPAGQTLATNGTWHGHSTRGKKPAFRFQRYNTPACKSCTLRHKCTKSKTNGRYIDRSEFATVIEQNNQRVKANPNYYRQRQQMAEHPWGTMKRQWHFDHVLTRGKEQVLGEAGLLFVVYNLVRCARICKDPKTFKKLLNRCIAEFSHSFWLILSHFEPILLTDTKCEAKNYHPLQLSL